MDADRRTGCHIHLVYRNRVYAPGALLQTTVDARAVRRAFGYADRPCAGPSEQALEHAPSPAKAADDDKHDQFDGNPGQLEDEVQQESGTSHQTDDDER